jgi:hypothetical protein
LCCILLSLLFSGHVDCDAVYGNRNVQSSVHRTDCKNLTNSKNSNSWRVSSDLRKTTQAMSSPISQAFNDKLCIRIFCTALLRVQGFKTGGLEMVSFYSRSGKGHKTRSSSGNGRDSFVFFCLLSLLSKLTHIWGPPGPRRRIHSSLFLPCM